MFTWGFVLFLLSYWLVAVVLFRSFWLPWPLPLYAWYNQLFCIDFLVGKCVYAFSSVCELVGECSGFISMVCSMCSVHQYVLLLYMNGFTVFSLFYFSQIVDFSLPVEFFVKFLFFVFFFWIYFNLFSCSMRKISSAVSATNICVQHWYRICWTIYQK